MPVTQPTKEQVRAYMHTRECARRPPPRPEEIRRQLGWRRSTPDAGYAAAPTALPVAASTLLLPGAMVQLATLLAVEWCFLAAGLQRRH
jgi:hypothetical protein